MGKLEVVLVLLLLLAIPPVVVVLYVVRTVRRSGGGPGALDVEVHPSEPARGAALRFVLRAPRGRARARVTAIEIDRRLVRALGLHPPEGFFEEGDVDDTVVWLGALDVERAGVELRVPGGADPDARGRLRFTVTRDDGTEASVAVDWPDDLHA